MRGSPAAAHLSRRLMLTLAAALLSLPSGTTLLGATEHSDTMAKAVSIAVFDFELEDHSAGSGIIAEDAQDARYLGEATAEARQRLAASGRYVLVETKGAASGPESAHGLRNCGGCAAGIAQRLGADQAMIGVVTRVNRTEFTMLIRITDAQSGAIVSDSYTNLRMGANYAWPRGVKWLMDNRLLPAAAR